MLRRNRQDARVGYLVIEAKQLIINHIVRKCRKLA